MRLRTLFGYPESRGGARLVLEHDSGAESLAIGEHDLLNAADRLAVLDRHESDSDFVTRLECLLAPAEVDHVRRIASLGRPVYDVALVILGIKLQKAMRIGPKPFRYRCFHGGPFRRVVCGRAVVREQRNGHRYEAEENRQNFIFHRIPPNLCPGGRRDSNWNFGFWPLFRA
jgi:hypothetical protein